MPFGDNLFVGLKDSDQVVEVNNVRHLGIEKYLRTWSRLVENRPEADVTITFQPGVISCIKMCELDIVSEAGQQRVRDLNPGAPE